MKIAFYSIRICNDENSASKVWNDCSLRGQPSPETLPATLWNLEENALC